MLPWQALVLGTPSEEVTEPLINSSRPPESFSCLICNPSAIRPSQFVPEPLHGYLMLAERLAVDPAPFGSAWNFGPAYEDAMPVHRIAD